MTRTLQLPDGTELVLTGDDPLWGYDEESGRTGGWDAAESVLRDSEGKVLRKVRKGRQRSNTEPRQQGTADKAVAHSRFVTLNQFVDECAKHFEPLTNLVYTVVFRFADAKTNTVDVSISTIAGRLSVSDRSVRRAIDTLRDCQLITRTRRGTRQGGASRYQIDVRPADRLPDILAWKAANGRPQPAKRSHQNNSQPVTRDQLGQFTTGQP